MPFDVSVVPLVDYGDVKPWIFSGGTNAHFAVGSNTGIRIFGDVALEVVDSHDLHAEVTVRAKQKLHIGLQFFRPENANAEPETQTTPKALQAHLKETLQWWHDWSDKIVSEHVPGVNSVRSAITLT